MFSKPSWLAVIKVDNLYLGGWLHNHCRILPYPVRGALFEILTTRAASTGRFSDGRWVESTNNELSERFSAHNSAMSYRGKTKYIRARVPKLWNANAELPDSFFFSTSSIALEHHAKI